MNPETNKFEPLEDLGPEPDKPPSKKVKDPWPNWEAGHLLTVPDEVGGQFTLKLVNINKGKRRLTFTPLDRKPPASRPPKSS